MTLPIERRHVRRLTAEEVPHDLLGRIRPGHDVRVLNVSSWGVLIETSRRLLPGTSVDLHLELREARHLTRARVIRSHVAVVTAHALIFRSALDVERPIPWLADGLETIRTGSRRPMKESGQ
jgi:hypothetical protein